MHPRMVIAVSLDGYRFHPGMASWDGDRSITGWRSIHPGMVIAESRNGDQCILGRRSMHPWIAIVHHWIVSKHPWMAIDASLDGDHVSRDGYRCIPGWRSINLAWHLGMAIDAPRDGNRNIPGWRSFRPRMAIDASQNCDHASRYGYHYNPGWRSMHPGMAIDTSRDGDRCFWDANHCIPGWRSRGDHRCISGWRSQYP